MASNTEGKSRYSQTRIRRSMLRKQTRFRIFLRLSATSCWRRTRISASREARASNPERSASRIRLSNASIARCSNTLAARRHADEVLKRDSQCRSSWPCQIPHFESLIAASWLGVCRKLIAGVPTQDSTPLTAPVLCFRSDFRQGEPPRRQTLPAFVLSSGFAVCDVNGEGQKRNFRSCHSPKVRLGRDISGPASLAVRKRIVVRNLFPELLGALEQPAGWRDRE